MATKPDKNIAEELRILIRNGLWASHYERCRCGGADKLAGEAGRFRDALQSAGVNCSAEEVRDALLDHAALAPEVRAPEPSGAESEEATTAPEPVSNGRRAEADRVASRALYRLYDRGVRVELQESGELHAEGLTGEQQVLLEEHSEAIKRLLSEKAMAEVWSPAVHYLARELQRAGAEPGDPRYDRATVCLDAAQEAYGRDEHGLCRYELRRACLAASGRL